MPGIEQLSPEARLKMAHDEDLRVHLNRARGACNGCLSDLAYALDDLSSVDERARYVAHWGEVMLERLRVARVEVEKAVKAAEAVKGIKPC